MIPTQSETSGRCKIVSLALCILSFILCGQQFGLAGPLVSAGQGRGALAIASDGRIGELVYENKATGEDRLLYRERLPGQTPGAWEAVVSVKSNGGEPDDDAMLRFDAQGRAVVICRLSGHRSDSFVNPSSWFVERIRSGRAKWVNGRPLLKTTWGDRGIYLSYLRGPDSSVNVLNFAWWMDKPFEFERITAPQRSETPDLPWKGGMASTSSEAGDYFPLDESTAYAVNSAQPPDWEPRHVSTAIDPSGTVHIVYAKGKLGSGFPVGIEQRSWLLYSCRKPGEMNFSAPVKLNAPDPAFGDGAVGACIAAAPNGTVAIAAGFVPRSPRGSTSGNAELRYLVKQANGTWSSSVVANSADDYLLGDGPRGTGIDPWLTFDSKSRPSIVFTDHASEHNPFCKSYRGQVRLATRPSATDGTWTISKLLSRGAVSPRNFQTWSPAVAAGGGKIAVSAISSVRSDRANSAPSFRYDFFERTVYPFETLPFTAIPPKPAPVKIGAVELGQTTMGYGLRVNGELTAITSGNANANATTVPGWTPLGAAAAAGRNYTLYWKAASTGQFALWDLNEQGGLTAGRVITRAELLSAETKLKFDLDGDGKIGS